MTVADTTPLDRAMQAYAAIRLVLVAVSVGGPRSVPGLALFCESCDCTLKNEYALAVDPGDEPTVAAIASAASDHARQCVR